MNISLAIPPLRAGVVVLAVAAGCGRVNVVRKQGVEMPSLQFPLRSFTYPSGLRVLVEHDSRTKLAGVFLVVGSGSTSDPAGREGLAHYVEHLAFRSRPDGEHAFSTLLEEIGGFSANAFTALDETVYYELGLATDLHEILRLEGARMVAPVFRVPDPIRATELDVVRNELRLRNETGFVGQVLNDLQAAVFPKGHPYERPGIGTLQTLGSIGASDVDAFVKANYRPDNMTLLILGDVNLDTADRLIAENLPRQLLEAPAKMKIPQRMPAVAPPVPVSPPASAQLERKVASVTAPEIWLGWSLPRGFDTDEYLLDFVAGAAQRRLSTVILDDKDVATVSVRPVPGVQASMLLCRIVLYQGTHPEESRDRVLAELPRIWTSREARTEVYDEDAFARSRRVATVEQVSAAQDLIERGVKRATITHFSQDPNVYSRAVRDLTSMRRKQVQDYFEPFVTRERARALLFVPPAGALASTERANAVLSGPVTEQEPGAPAQPVAAGAGAPIAERLQSLVATSERSTLRLSNGLTVILQRRPGLPLVSAGLMLPAVPTTSKESAAAEVAWFGAHPTYLMNGSPDVFGGSIHRSQATDHVSYFVEGASGNTEILLATLAEYARSLSIDRGDVLWLREYLVPFWKRIEQDPRTVAERKLLSELFPNSPYGKPLTSEQLAESSRDAADDWLRRTHSPANATLAVVGDFDPKEIGKFVEDSFGNWSGGSAEAAATSVPPPAVPTSGTKEVKLVVTDRPGVTQTEIEFACLLPPAKERAVATRHEVAARLLRGRLWRVLREELGATYGSSATAVALRGGSSYLEVESAVEGGKLAPVLAAMNRALAGIGAAPPSANELAAAKLKRASDVATARMTNRGIVRRELTRATMGYPAAQADEAAEIAAISPQDVQADFQACLAGNPTLSLVGDEKRARTALATGWH